LTTGVPDKPGAKGKGGKGGKGGYNSSYKAGEGSKVGNGAEICDHKCEYATSVPVESDGPPHMGKILEKAEWKPKLLILALGNMEGFRKMQKVREWAETNGYEYEYCSCNPNDNLRNKQGREIKAAIQAFLDQNKHQLHRIVIFHQGHGRPQDGAWCTRNADAITPQEVKAMVCEGNNVGESRNITIVTGGCYGGHWLQHFQGISAVGPHKSCPVQQKFWEWLWGTGEHPNLSDAQNPHVNLKETMGL